MTDDPFGQEIGFLTDNLALAKTEFGRVFAIDTDRMTIREEVLVPGHEPKPMKAFYPHLNLPGTGTDICAVMRAGDAVVVTCPAFTLRGARQSLYWYRDDGL